MALARAAETFGYHRYWVAEHHAKTTHASNAPEVLVAAIAGATHRIRVGSGGVLLTHYSPFKVAEVFAALAGLYPGRIDLGIGRDAGGGPAVSYALQADRRRRPEDDFRERLTELVKIVRGRVPPRLSREAMAALRGAEMPELWLLGSSQSSAELAAELGLPYAFADFIHPGLMPVTAAYRKASKVPRVLVALSAVCARTDKKAATLELVSPTGARRVIAGTPPRVRVALEASARAYGVDEVMILTPGSNLPERVRSYELIAREFGLID